MVPAGGPRLSIAVFELDRHHQHHACVVGLGLVGHRIAWEMSVRCRPGPQLRVVWTSADSIIDAISRYTAQQDVQILDMVWSAGKCGFGATDDELQAEFSVFNSVMDWLASQSLDARVSFLSSAGGVYENTGRVSDIADISPVRPYGRWKLKQERVLETLGLTRRIYRVSTAYGPRNPGARVGLVNAVVERSRQSQTVMIYCRENTLRDYVWSPDIARHVVERIEGKPGEEIEILAYGYPLSAGSLLRLTQTITRRRVRAIFADNESNSSDIVFDSSLPPHAFRRTSILEGVRVLNSRLL
jgi:nucleoside-diphosphate-sugar epimerase